MSQPSSQLNPAVFLDRDGTINEEKGYINHPSRFRLLKGVPEAIRLLNKNGFLTIIVTNQAGVARGYFKEELVQRVHENMHKQLKQAGAYIDAVYYCPHHPEAGKEPYRKSCRCRKPSPGMIEQACSDLPIDLTRSYLVGDRHKDILFARQFSLTAVMVLTGYGRGEYEYQKGQWREQPDHIAPDLYHGVQWIIAHSRSMEDKTFYEQ